MEDRMRGVHGDATGMPRGCRTDGSFHRNMFTKEEVEMGVSEFIREVIGKAK